MTHGINIATNRNILSNNSNFLSASQPITGQNFREVLSTHRNTTTNPTINNGSSRDDILNTISQTRAGSASVFFAPPIIASREPFSIRNLYTMPPEEVKPLLRQLEDEIHSADLCGKSNLEIYEFIENKFIEVFGEDFMIGFNLLKVVPGNNMWNNPDRPMSNYEFVDIGHSFNELVSGRVGYSEMLNINRTRLFGDKNDNEVIDAIIAKHPQPLTNRSLALIEGELQSVGFNFFAVGRLVDALIVGADELPWNSNYPSWSEFEERWTALLNSRADVQHLAFLHNGDLKEARTNPLVFAPVMQTKNILEKLGAKLGPDGLFMHSENFKLNLKDLINKDGMPDDPIDELIEALNRHDKKLRESKERYENNREIGIAGEERSSKSSKQTESVGTEV